MTLYWRTKSGVAVKSGASFIDNGGARKVYAIRVKTGGYHGVLRVDQLTRISAKEARAKESRHG